MSRHYWREWLRRHVARLWKTAWHPDRPRVSAFVPGLEDLEGRLVPATVTIRNFTDGLAGTQLRGAIINSHAGDKIVLVAGTYRLTLGPVGADGATTGDLNIDHNLTIQGAGAGKTVIEADFTGGEGGPDRVLQLSSSATVTLSGLTIQNGTAPQNDIHGISRGGGIANFGALTLDHVTVAHNQSNGFSGAEGPGDGLGGGIYNGPSSLLVLNDSTVTDNHARGFAGAEGLSATQGQGGGIFNDQGTVRLTRGVVSHNDATGGTPTIGLREGGGGRAGGLLNLGGVMSLAASTVSDNEARGGDAYLGGAGQGGGIFNDYGGNLTITGSTIASNSAGGGSGFQGARGGDGQGGGIFNRNDGTLDLTNSTLAGNTARGGTHTDSNDDYGGSGTGGGLFNASVNHVRLVNATVADNQAQKGTVNGGSGTGGGIADTVNDYGGNGSALRLLNTLVGRNTADTSGADVSGDFTSLGHNFIANDGGSTGFVNGQNGDQVGTANAPIDPLIGSLANNGGPTKTYALLSTSPARDGGTVDVPQTDPPLTTDQRGAGFARKSGPAVDIGAFEFVNKADVAVAMTVSNARPAVGTNVTYQITVRNNGPGVATGVTVSNSLPGGVQFISARPGAGSPDNITVSGRNLTFDVGTLAAGASATYLVVVKITSGGNISNTAKATSTSTDPVLSNNQATVQTLMGLPIVVSRPILAFLPALPMLPPPRPRRP